MTQDQLKRARDALGMKPWELGVAFGVSEAEVCLWEKGKRAMPERYICLMGAIIQPPGTGPDPVQFDICIECVHALTKSCRKMVASPFRIFVDEEGRIRDTRQ